jgi:DUF4097 and DUF4098 domain-containing protein YvlB
MNGRRIALSFAGAVSALLIGGTAFSAVSWLGRTTEAATIDIDASSIRAVEVRTTAGGVRITGDGAERITGERRATFSLSRPAVTEEVVGEVLVLHATCRGVVLGPCDVDYRLTVPRTVAVRVVIGAGSIDVRDVDGRVDATTEAGGIRLVGVGGPARASSGAGTVTGAALRSTDLEARTSAGSVNLTFAVGPETVVAASEAGSVTVVVPDDATAYRVDATTDAGRERVEVRTDPTARRRIEATTSAGNVTVRYPTEP